MALEFMYARHLFDSNVQTSLQVYFYLIFDAIMQVHLILRSGCLLIGNLVQ